MQKNATPKNWHRADIVAALKKKGWSLRALSIEAGLSPNTLRSALAAPYLKREKGLLPLQSEWNRKRFGPNGMQIGI